MENLEKTEMIDIRKIIKASNLFDKTFYLINNRDVRVSDMIPFEHYIINGIKEDRKPNQDFDPIWYKKYYQDVKETKQYPLVHFILFGKRENRFINEKEKEKYEKFSSNGLFDKIFYKNFYKDLTNQNDDFDCLLHYIRHGEKEGRIPCYQQDNKLIEAKNNEEVISNEPINNDELEKNLSQTEIIEYDVIKSFNLDWSAYKLENEDNVVILDPILDYVKNWKEQKPIIPSFFDTSFYLEIYPDVAGSNINPLIHYLTNGREEGRQALFNEDNILKGKMEYIPEKETIIFVSHESSASGAPLLGYNIADKLTNKYNLIHIVIKESNIHESFLDNCDLMFYGIETDTTNNAYIFIKRIMKDRDIKCVICNSVVTYPVLHAAYTLDIPTLMLIHEFTDYIKPAATVMNTIFLADNVIVPATIIQDSIQEELIKYSNNKITPSNIHIIPQGKLPYIPESYGDSDSVEVLCRKLKINSPEEAKIIVGSGWVQIRKGVDLFVATAKYIKEKYNKKCKFVWVGDGFNPEGDLAYSVWLQRELKFSGLEDDFIFLEHQKNLDTIFSISDVFCLTSRMDPFPNVVIDALNHDLHIACFDNASGSSEFLEKNNASCTIVDYVDTYRLAEGIIKYFEKETTPSGINRNLVDSHLNFDKYVEDIERLAEDSIEFKSKCQNIVNRLIQSGEFDSDYFGGQGSHEQRCRTYVETSLKGISLQNPKIGFSQSKWLYENSKNNHYIVPLYEALEMGKTITHEVEIVPYESTQTVDFFYAVHLHLFYVDLADEFAQYFKNLPGKFDILITIVKEEDREATIEAFSVCGANDIKVVHVENIGRDSGPLFFGLKNEVLDGKYEIIGHFHSKKSFDINDGIGNRWRKYLTENLIGDTNIAKSVIELFNNPKVGLVFPEDSHVVDIGENKKYVEDLCTMMNIPIIEETNVFPLGNMFWARVEAIKDLFDLDQKVVLQKEPLPYDGSYMHAIERITPALIEKNNYIYKTVCRKGTRW